MLLVKLHDTLFDISDIFSSTSHAATQGDTDDVRGKYSKPIVSQGVAIFIPGSGDQEIDGNVPPLVTSSPYRQIADGLAHRGITVFQLRKRTLSDVLKITKNSGTTALTTLSRDIEQAIAITKQDTGRECVWLIGQSEGGLFALLVAQNRRDICGMILAAAPARPIPIKS